MYQSAYRALNRTSNSFYATGDRRKKKAPHRSIVRNTASALLKLNRDRDIAPR
jgi:hypothetical protein